MGRAGKTTRFTTSPDAQQVTSETPRKRGRPRSNTAKKILGCKQKQLTDVIEISSSYHESIPHNVQNEGKCSEGSNPDMLRKTDQDVLNEVSQVKSSVEEIKQVVNNLTKFMFNNTHCFSPPQTISGQPMMVTNMQTPRNSAVINSTEMISETLPSPAGRLIRSTSSKYVTAKDDNNEVNFNNNLVKSLFTLNEQGKISGVIINNRPNNVSNQGRTSGVEIPEWIPIVFRPPRGMILDEVEAALIAYIFVSSKIDDKSREEVLIKCGWGHGNRAKVISLMPKTFVDQEVLNFLASSLTYNERTSSDYSSHWFLPTTFSQLALGWRTTPQTLMANYQKDYMGKVELARKIFVPINDENVHWFLLVVDMCERQLLLLDSQRCPTRMEWRRRHVKKLALFLEEMLLDKTFYECASSIKPLISEFKLVEPDGLGQQINGFDCGVWVAHWMTDCVWFDEYDKISVNPATSRMRIAIDLVMHPYNKIKDEVIRKAFKNWNDFEAKRKSLVKA